jgi:hypothetical protein
MVGISLGAAALGSAIIGGGATLLSSKKNSKAIKQATAAQADSTAQQIAYQREADARNLGALSPFMARGNTAGDTINAALGIGGGYAPQAAPQGALTVQSGYTGANPAAMTAPGYSVPRQNPYKQALLDSYPVQDFGQAPMQAMGQPQGQQGQPQGQSPAQAATSAYELFKQSTGYTTRMAEGQRALNSGYAGAGVLQSGAAQRAALRYGQEFASGEFGNWLGYLGNQQGLGFAGASALAGVSQGSADRMGAISQNNANTASQAAIARAQNQGALWTGLAGTVGQAAGALSSYNQSSFRPPMSGWGTPGYY